MSLESKIETLTAAVMALTAALQTQQGAAPVAPSYPPQQAAPQVQYQAPPQQAAPVMPAQPFPTAPVPQAAPQGLPFNDNVSAAAWATAAWTQAATVNQDVAMARFQSLMGNLGAADFNQLTPDKFPMLYQGIQAIKAELGIQG